MTDEVVALYVDPRGPYPRLVSDWYDEARNARTYAGDLPVVAHPPCGPWGRLRHLSRKDDPMHAVHAVATVRRVGGVLEHPRYSKLWDACSLPKPGEAPDRWGGWTLAVNQCDWGHPARKPTWLYIVRASVCSARQRRRTPEAFAQWLIDLAASVPPREPTHAVIRSRTGPNAYGNRSPVHLKKCSDQMNRRTPEAFARFLLEVAQETRR